MDVRQPRKLCSMILEHTATLAREQASQPTTTTKVKQTELPSSPHQSVLLLGVQDLTLPISELLELF